MLLDPPPTRLTMDSEASALDALRHALDRTASSMKATFNDRLNQLYDTVLTSPGTVLTLFLVVSSIFAVQGMAFQNQIDDDVEIFLPDGAPSTDLLLEVRTEWSTESVGWKVTTGTSVAIQPVVVWILTKPITAETTVCFGFYPLLRSSKRSIRPTVGSTIHSVSTE